jgi:hypothetical protein
LASMHASDACRRVHVQSQYVSLSDVRPPCRPPPRRPPCVPSPSQQAVSLACRSVLLQCCPLIDLITVSQQWWRATLFYGTVTSLRTLNWNHASICSVVVARSRHLRHYYATTSMGPGCAGRITTCNA